MLAIIFAFKHYFDCLVGKKFFLKCDHHPLIWIKDQKIKGCMTFQEFEFDIEHITGKCSSVSDALSRRPVNVIFPEMKKFDWFKLQQNSLQDIPSRYSKHFITSDGVVRFKGRIVVPQSSTACL